MENNKIEEIIVNQENIEVGEELEAIPVSPLVEQAEKMMLNFEKIKRLSLQVTNKNDWVNIAGKPYLTSSGCEKVARLFGLSIYDVTQEKITGKDDKGEYYIWQVKGKVGRGKDFIEAIGSCSSRDSFFAKIGDKLKPLSEVDEPSIMKAAYSNFLMRGVTAFLGIRNLTWEDIKQARIDASTIAKVTYQEKKEEKEQANKATHQQKQAIKSLINTLQKENPEGSYDVVDVEALSKKEASELISKLQGEVKKLWEKSEKS